MNRVGTTAKRARTIAWLAVAILTGCGSSTRQSYLEAEAAAHRAYSAGRYEEAARGFQDAASKATRRKDRDEMLYLSAASMERGGHATAARDAYVYLAKLSADGERTARAEYEVASIEIAQGDATKGHEMMAAFVKRWPTSGVARRALQRYVAWLAETSGKAAAIAWLRQQQEWLHANSLGEEASYGIAKLLEESGDNVGARDAFVACAKRYPYPVGGLFDDALYRASELDEKLGDPKLAVKHLREMLAVQEPVTFNGSYTRPRFPQAQLRIGVLMRDAIGDRAAARREFRKVVEQFPTSILRDDALWSEAMIAWQDKDEAGACGAAKLLAAKAPDSRYAGCLRMLCSTAPEPTKGKTCPAYVRQQIEDSSRKP